MDFSGFIRTRVVQGFLVLAVAGTFFFALSPRSFDIRKPDAVPPVAPTQAGTGSSGIIEAASSSDAGVPVPPSGHLAAGAVPDVVLAPADLPNQLPLPNPPAIVRGLYLTSWSAGSARKIDEIIGRLEASGFNAVVIDIKDYSGYVAYRTGLDAVRLAGAEDDIRIVRPNELLKKLHDKGIYVIGRVSVFQDPVLASAHPEWAVQDTSTGAVWKDRKGLAWLDAAATPVWDYHVAIAENAFTRGFDEINFDYIRFPSDGDLTRAVYPFWDETGERRSNVVRRFFEHLRAELPGKPISADLFGLTTSATGDLGIGQVIEDAYANFDYVSPMVYPSHYADGFNGYANPAAHPYEVVFRAMQDALRRLAPRVPGSASSTASSTSEPSSDAFPLYRAKLRPWLQSFDLGAVYDREKVSLQVKAVEDVLAGSPHAYAGFLLWDPANRYRTYP